MKHLLILLARWAVLIVAIMVAMSSYILLDAGMLTDGLITMAVSAILFLVQDAIKERCGG